jgi:hypothetical protein
MRNYLFSDEEISHLKYIRENSPIRIWFEHIQYVFEYEKFNFTLEVELAEKVNLSDSIKNNHLRQYAMKTAMRFKDKKFVAQEGSELLVENQKIEKIEIARTKLYFTQHTKISESLYNSESGQINPNQNLPKNIENEITVDAGVVLKLENRKIFNLLIIDNDDDFEFTNYKYQEGDFRDELSDKYQFITLS